MHRLSHMLKHQSTPSVKMHYVKRTKNDLNSLTTELVSRLTPFIMILLTVIILVH
jgi:hypothetical protein